MERLLASHDESFDPMITTIKERPDYEVLQLVDVMKLLNAQEEEFEKEQSDSSSEEEGEILSNYGSSNEEEYENQHTITRDLDALTERLNELRRHNMCLARSDKEESGQSRRLPPLDICCYKCKSFGHYIIDCP